MKKFFLFAAVAGMLASCSSESLTGSDPNIEPAQEERVPILLGVSSPSVNVSRGTTRGTGTVGGVGVGDPNNGWVGQRIHAFMFKKDSLVLATDDADKPYYNEAEMITPGTTYNLIPGQSTATNIGEAMLADGKIQYYPHIGNFDFFGYHGDDAVPAENVDKSDSLWVVPFVINGSQDLMSTKAVLTDAQATAMGQSTDYYSAKAARKDVQPVLSFNHLLSRLAFVIKAGNDNAGGWVAAQDAVLYNDVDEYNAAKGTNLNADEFAALNEGEKTKIPAVLAHQDVDKAVYVKSIEVLSKTTGKMAVAWTNEPSDKITWTNDGSPDWLALKERPVRYCLNSAPATSTSITKAAYDVLPDGAEAGDANDKTDYSLGYCLKSDPTTVITKAAYDVLPDGATDGDANDKTDYTVLTNANDALVALTPTYPTMTTSGVYPETSVGEALIVAPSTEDYQMHVTVSQKVPTNWNTPTALDTKEQTYELNIPVPVDDHATDTVNEAAFQANTSYKVVLTVYGFERIVVTTEIKPWDTGAPINVGQD